MSGYLVIIRVIVLLTLIELLIIFPVFRLPYTRLFLMNYALLWIMHIRRSYRPTHFILLSTYIQHLNWFIYKERYKPDEMSSSTRQETRWELSCNFTDEWHFRYKIIALNISLRYFQYLHFILWHSVVLAAVKMGTFCK